MSFTAGFSQTVADKKFYLVDSLNLSELNDNDKQLLDSALTQYKLAKNDSTKFYWLDFISNNLSDDSWMKYNELLSVKCAEALKKNNSEYFKKIYASSLNNLGYAAENSGEIEKAINFYFAALKLYEEIKNKEGEAYCLNNLAVVFENQDEYEQALKYHLKALEVRKKLGIDEQIIQSLNNIGTYYYKIKDNENALIYYFQALKIAEKNNDFNHLALINGNIGNCYLHNINQNNGIEYFKKSIGIYNKMGDIRGEAWGLYNLGNVHLRRKEYSKAIEIFELSLKNAAKINYVALRINTYKMLFRTYALTKEWEKAYNYYHNYNLLNDSLKNEETQTLVIKQQTKYEYEKQKAIDDAEHEKQLAIEKEAKAKQKVIIYATAGGLILVALFLIFIFNRLQVTRKQKAVIEEQKVVVEKAHHELEEKNKEITDSITYAKRIQEAILPSRYTLAENLKNGFILYKPKDIVAGDFYWMETKTGSEWRVEGDENPSHKTQHSPLILFAAADCTGHGVPGAMVSVICSNALSKTVLEEHIVTPGKILDRTKELVVERLSKNEEDVKDGMDISLCSLNQQTNQLEWSGANNPLWIIRAVTSSSDEGGVSRSNNEYELLEYKPDKQPIGKTDQTKPFTTHQINLIKGDTIYIFTDGYQDQFGGEKGKKFKAAQLKELLLGIQDKTMDEQKELLNNAFENWKGNLEQVDDVCIIGVRI